MPDQKGKDEAQAKKPIRLNAKYYDRLYAGHLPPLPINEQEFRFKLIRKGRLKLDIGGLVESCEWRDEGTIGNINTIATLRGTASLRQPHPDDPLSRLVIRDGQQIRCDVKWGGKWRDVWLMRIQSTSDGAGDGIVTLELADDMALLSRSTYDFSYKATKNRHKKGYRYWELARRVARVAKVPLDRRMPKGRRWIKDFTQKQISGLEAIRQLVELEQQWTGLPHIIYWKDGKLKIGRMRRNATLYVLADQIREAAVKKSRKAMVYTAITGIGSMKVKDADGKERDKKVEVTVVDEAAVKHFGYIHKDLKLGSKLESKDEARTLCRREIRDSLDSLTIIENMTHAGIAFTRRGDAVRVNIPWEQIKGNKGYLFVISVVHSLSGGDYTMALTLAYRDPLDPNDLRKARDAAERYRKRQKKGKDTQDRHGGDSGPSDGTSPPVEGSYDIIGTPYVGTHTLGNWQSDNAVDLAVPEHTAILAVIDGTIGRVEGPFTSDMTSQFAGGAIYLSGGGHTFWYKHLSGSSVSPGDTVRAGERIGSSGGANGVPHLHFAAEPPDDPQDYV